jgi:hypothetical protein
VFTTDVEKRFAALKSSTSINGFQRSHFLLLTAEANASGMVSNQNTGFPIPESRQKFSSFERIKIACGCADDHALTGRSETGSETEQVGSGMNGRRRSCARF